MVRVMQMNLTRLILPAKINALEVKQTIVKVMTCLKSKESRTTEGSLAHQEPQAPRKPRSSGERNNSMLVDSSAKERTRNEVNEKETVAAQ
jgi:hypothetical protein